MKSIRLAMAAAAALVCGTAFAAGSLSETAKGGSDLWVQQDRSGYSVEYISDGKAVGLQFDIQDKAITEGSYSCAESLKEGHLVSCTLNAKEGYLRVIVFSLENTVLGDNTLVRVSTNSSRSSLTAKKGEATKSSGVLKNIVIANSKGENVTPSHL